MKQKLRPEEEERNGRVLLYSTSLNSVNKKLCTLAENYGKINIKICPIKKRENKNLPFTLSP